MKCDECGSPTHVTESFNDGTTIHRLRQCVNPECRWKCNSKEQFVDDVYSPTFMGKKARKEKQK